MSEENKIAGKTNEEWRKLAEAASGKLPLNSGMPLETKEPLIEVAPGVHVSRKAILATVGAFDPDEAESELRQRTPLMREVERDIMASREFLRWQEKVKASQNAMNNATTLTINGEMYVKMSELPSELQEVVTTCLLVGEPEVSYQRLCDKIQVLQDHAGKALKAARSKAEVSLGRALTPGELVNSMRESPPACA